MKQRESDVMARILYAEQLGEQVDGKPENCARVIPLLVSELERETDPRVIEALVYSLGHAWEEGASMAILASVRADNPDKDIRLALARSIPGGVQSKPGIDAVAGVLVQLTADCDGDVHDWACFGLSQLECDSPAIRDALIARINDEHDDARCEALVALAQLGDPRVLAPLLERVNSDRVWKLELEAAGQLSHPDLWEPLVELRDSWEGDESDPDIRAAADFAICRCHPDAKSVATQFEADLVEQLSQQAPADMDVKVLGSYPVTRLVFSWAQGEWEYRVRIWESDSCPLQLNQTGATATWIQFMSHLK